MRKLVLLGLFFMIAATSVFVGCSKKDDSSSSSTSLSVDKSSITATKDGGTSVITVTAGAGWTAVSSQTWATVTPASGSGNGSIVVIATANTSTSSRTATITIVSGSDTKVVVVTQDGTSGGGGSSLSVDKTTITATKDAVTSTVAVTATSAWTASSNQSWATVSPASGSSSGSLTITVTANTTSSSRTATITVTSGSSTVTVTVTQDATPAATTVTYNGYTYKTVVIGTQTWFAENLQTEKYNDGTSPTYITDNTQWANATTGAYCSYNNDATMRATYGRLYNYYAVNTGKLCPSGWHVPSDAEWTKLIDYLGGKTVAGGKMKATSGWASPNTGATNESGFFALAGGFRGSLGSNWVGNDCYFWSSTQYSDNAAWLLALYYNDAAANRGSDFKTIGYSVRCLKN